MVLYLLMIIALMFASFAYGYKSSEKHRAQSLNKFKESIAQQ